jgi:hypothetical protein
MMAQEWESWWKPCASWLSPESVFITRSFFFSMEARSACRMLVTYLSPNIHCVKRVPLFPFLSLKWTLTFFRIRAAINLEACGTAGPEILFQATSEEVNFFLTCRMIRNSLKLALDDTCLFESPPTLWHSPGYRDIWDRLAFVRVRQQLL